MGGFFVSIMENTGSFGAAAGGISPELQASIQRRAGAQGGTSAVTAGAPTFDPSTQPAQPPTGQPASQPVGGAPAPTLDKPQISFESPEAKMIVGSLSTRLKALSKMQGV